MAEYDETKFEELKGKTLKRIDLGALETDGKHEEVAFVTEDGETYRLYHWQDCCEYVYLEDVSGDLDDLIGNPILLAEEVSQRDKNPEGMDPPEYQESFTWTFYKLSTIKGSVTLRWYGGSNGYYSESVNFMKVEK